MSRCGGIKKCEVILNLNNPLNSWICFFSQVISGQNLPKPKGAGAKGDVVDPYVYVEIHGIPADCTERRTRTVTQNGDNPVFDESFEFQINLPELAMVRFVVLDDDFIGDDFIGWCQSQRSEGLL